MVLQYYNRNTQFSPTKFFRKYVEKEPYGSGDRLTADSIVSAARSYGYSAGWGRISPVLPKLIKSVAHFVDTLAIPLIACQRLTDQRHITGHFRVIVGIEDNAVILHDPSSTTIRWHWEKLRDYWRPTGANVTGGVAIWIAKKPIDRNLLLPDQPNPWKELSWWPTRPL